MSASRLRLTRLQGSLQARCQQWLAQHPFDVDTQVADVVARRQLPFAKRSDTRGWRRALRSVTSTMECRDVQDGDVRRQLCATDAAAIALGRDRRGQASPLPLGCHSLVVWGRQSGCGRLLHGRSFDGFLDDDHDVHLVLHQQTGKLSHLSVHHRGAFLPGVTAVNEAGVVVTAHPVATRAVDVTGEPGVLVFDRVLQHARGVASAVDVLKRSRLASGWVVSLSSNTSADPVIVEVDAKGVQPLRSKRTSFLAAAQGFRTRKQADAYAVSDLQREREWSKLSLLNRLARRQPPDAAALLASLQDARDAYDPSRRRPWGNTLVDVTHSDSVVFDVDDDALHVACGPLPRHSQRARVSLSAAWAGDLDAEVEERPLSSTLEQTRLVREALLFAQEGQLDGALSWLPDGDDVDGLVHLLRAQLLLLADRPDDVVAAAEAALSASLTSPYREASAHVVRGHAHDLRGDRAQAVAAYAAAEHELEDLHSSLLRRARRGRRLAFSQRDRQSLRLVAEVANVVV